VVVSPPPPPPTPTSFSFQDQGLQVRDGVNAVDQFPITVTITDNDGAASFGAVQFDGKQSVRVQLTYGAAVFDETFAASNYLGNAPSNDPRAGLSTAARTVSLSSWEIARTGSAADGFYILGLNKGTGAAPSFVSLSELRSVSGVQNLPYLDSFQLLGTATPAASMPVTGSAAYSGEAFGQFIPVSGASFGSPFLASAVMNVDFTKTAGAISGTIDNVAQSKATDALRFTLSFTADISGSGFTGTASAVNAHGGTALPAVGQNGGFAGLQGPIQGAFYGPSSSPAAEAGGTFALVGSQYKTLPFAAMTGGFVAGK
jgi:hypothetical protein